MAEGYEPAPEYNYKNNGVNDDITSYTSSNRYIAPSDGYILFYLTPETNKYIEASFCNGWSGKRVFTDASSNVLDSVFVPKGSDIYISNNTTTNGKVYFRGIL